MKKILDKIDSIDLKINSVNLHGEKNKKFYLDVNGVQKMSYSNLDQVSYYQLLSSIDLAYGNCVLSGLGMSFVTEKILEKEEVETVTVYEINKDVIALNKLLGLNHSKLTIINEDINNVKNITCDCLLLDHYENEPDHLVINDIKNINNKNNAKLLWFWKIEKYITEYKTFKKIEIDEAYKQFTKDNDLKNMPKLSENKLLTYVEMYNNKK
jgi:hypothetical protein